MLVESTKLWLRGSELELTVSATLNKELEPAHLIVKLRKENSSTEWSGSFTDQYVEEIAKKTGNFKRFPIFVEMLFSAMRKASPVVGLDILTTEDLEYLKRGEKQPFSATTSINFGGKKLYLILTYAVAFDRVHYPLPLCVVDEETGVKESMVEALRDEVSRLQAERLHHLEKISWLLKENDRLKHMLKQESQKRQESSAPRGVFPSADLIDRLQSVLYEIEQARSQYKHTRNLSQPLKSLVDIVSDIVNETQSPLPHSNRGRVVRERALKTRSSKTMEEEARSLSRKSAQYKVLKSRPLVLASPEKTRVHSPVRRSGSFQRFDPTLYVYEREKRLRERRSASRQSSVDSHNSSLSSSKSSLIRNTRPAKGEVAEGLRTRKSFLNENSSLNRQSRVKGGLVGTMKRKETRSGSRQKWDGNVSDSEEIEQRLSALRNYLHSQSIATG
ncbi:hypothetical protein BC829DRAFT_408786 [Chytridium lagenaria]|nr:hypothetical protein BC829DRAFT_408786 [Chytridium lagenaria]